MYVIWIWLHDRDWLEVLSDLEELGADPETLACNLRCRKHLTTEKRAIGLEHLKQVN